MLVLGQRQLTTRQRFCNLLKKVKAAIHFPAAMFYTRLYPHAKSATTCTTIG